MGDFVVDSRFLILDKCLLVCGVTAYNVRVYVFVTRDNRSLNFRKSVEKLRKVLLFFTKVLQFFKKSFTFRQKVTLFLPKRFKIWNSKIQGSECR